MVSRGAARAARWRGARWRGGEEEDDRWGPGVSGGERENAADGRREIKKKTYSCEYANDARAERLRSQWAGVVVGSAAWAGRQAKAGWGRGRPAGPKARKRNKRISELKSDFRI
jgi:hypothetical protein